MQEFIDNIKKENCASKLTEMCSVIDQNILNESQVEKAMNLFIDAVHDAADPLLKKTLFKPGPLNGISILNQLI